MNTFDLFAWVNLVKSRSMLDVMGASKIVGGWQKQVVDDRIRYVIYKARGAL